MLQVELRVLDRKTSIIEPSKVSNKEKRKSPLIGVNMIGHIEPGHTDPKKSDPVNYLH